MTYCQADEGEHEQADGASFTACGIIEDLQHGTGKRSDDGIDVFGNKQQHGKIDETGKDANQDASNHDLGPISGGIGEFLDTMGLQNVS